MDRRIEEKKEIKIRVGERQRSVSFKQNRQIVSL